MAQTNQTISSFYNVAQNREFSRDFLFRVLNITFAGGASFNESDLIYAKTAILPARDITNVPAPFMGLKFNLAGGAVYPGSEAYSLKFYCDASSSLRNKFLQESRRVFDDATSTGDYNIAGRASSMTLMQLNKNLEPVTTFKLVGLSIRSVGTINYSMAEGTGAPVDFDVTAAYHFFEENAPVVV
jgi:hypothetical protein